jgi:molybdenum cofactor cytidylyltransferase
VAIKIEDVTAILLAAGRAERFGSDKLRAEIDGVPIGVRSAATLRTLSFGRLLVVVGQSSLDYAGFEKVQVAPGQPLGASIAAGVVAAATTSCSACLIALADMPFVPPEHFAALLAAHAGGITASAVDGRPMVPAIFDRASFPALLKLERDEGARSLLGRATQVGVDERAMADIDAPSDLPN